MIFILYALQHFTGGDFISQKFFSGYAVAEGRPVRESRLPCCGIGVGWFLFILGFFLGAIPWYIGLLLLVCGRIDYREKPGYIAYTIAAILATIAIVLGVTREADDC
ncbi:60S ribosomal protein L18a-like protein [Eucalyptus grandis]|uniref:60S ribosomal protein L18a-like protein n=1 Tax=Eucalyptus grandis TaxID=71139 RepID=UPI00192EA2D4|nr:60S ribosomal protein L18a-like protein [Eucalyptus grandis]